VQKVPQLLDEIHWLIENRGLSFLMSGSSARKVRRGQANLLGGRAWRLELHPLVSAELEELNLLRILNRGMLPAHYLESQYRRSLKAYVQDYLKEEVFDEGLTRNVPAFSRFFESMGYGHGEMVNLSNVARDTGVDSKTVREYYQILVDTLLGVWIPPFKRRQERNVIMKASKFYLFDVGVAGAITGRRIESPRGPEFGKALEHFVLMELRAHAAYRELDHPIEFWRTKSGQEVDFVLGGGEIAIEVKGTSRVDPRDLRSLQVFIERHAPRKAIVICNERRARERDGIQILPIQRFLKDLWGGSIIT
jgi:predicted AAA+ superfamily ATPase